MGEEIDEKIRSMTNVMKNDRICMHSAYIATANVLYFNIHPSCCLSRNLLLTGVFGSANQTGSNGPDGFVGNDNAGHFFLGDTIQILGELLCADLVLDLEVVFGLGFTNAQNGLHSRRQDLLDLAVDGRIVVVEEGSALGVTTEDVFASNGQNHRGGNTSGVGTTVLEVDRLGTNGDSGVFDFLTDLGNERVGREDNDLGTERVLVIDGTGLITQKLGEASSEADGVFLSGGVHLPVSGHDGLARGVEGSGDRSLLGRGKGGSRSNKGGEDGGLELHG